MAGGVEMSRGMSPWGLVAAADMATGLTGTEVNPTVLSGCDAVFAPLGLGDGIGYGVEVVTDFQRQGSFLASGRLNPRARIHLYMNRLEIAADNDLGDNPASDPRTRKESWISGLG